MRHNEQQNAERNVMQDRDLNSS